MKLPEIIESRLQGRPFTLDRTGQSGAAVQSYDGAGPGENPLLYPAG